MLPRPHQDLAAVAFLTTLWYLQVKFITSQRLYLPYNIYVPHNIWRGHKPRPVHFNLKLVVQCLVLEETFIIADTIIAENKVQLHGREFSEVICQICFFCFECIVFTRILERVTFRQFKLKFLEKIDQFWGMQF